MIHPDWLLFIPILRKQMDDHGLSHIQIIEHSNGAPMSLGDLIEVYDSTHVYFDEYLSFKPADPDWRIYRVEGAPFEEWIGRAHITEFQQTPSISRSEDGKWQIIFSYDQGCLPAEVFDDESSFLTSLMDCLCQLFTDRVYILGVTFYPGGCSWGRITE